MTTTPRAPWRRALTAAAALGAAALLSGCMRLDMTMAVSEDDTITGSGVIAFSDEIAQMFGMEDGAEILATLTEQGTDLANEIPGAVFDDYSGNGHTGQHFTIDAVSIADFATETLSVTRQDDTFEFAASIDLTANTSPDAELERIIARTFESGVTITFPGRVTEANGDIDGNTVTWNPAFGQVNELHAVANATTSTGLPWWLLAITAGVVLAVAVIAALVGVRARNQVKPTAIDTGRGEDKTQDEAAQPEKTDDAVVERAVEPSPRPVTRRQAREDAAAKKRSAWVEPRRAVPLPEPVEAPSETANDDPAPARNTAWDDYDA